MQRPLFLAICPVLCHDWIRPRFRGIGTPHRSRSPEIFATEDLIYCKFNSKGRPLSKSSIYFLGASNAVSFSSRALFTEDRLCCSAACLVTSS